MTLHRVTTSALLRSLPRANHLQVMAGLLSCGEPVCAHQVIEYLWGDREDGGPLEASHQINIYVHWLRKFGWKIRKHHGLQRSIHGRGHVHMEPAWICDGASDHGLIKYRIDIERQKKCAA